MKRFFLSFINKPYLVTAVSLVIAVAIGAAVMLGGSAGAHARFAQAGPGDISLTGQAAGPDAQHLTLAFTAGGQIDSVRVHTGDEVHTGDVLAALDPESTAGQLTQAQAAYDSAVAAYQKVVNGATGPAIDAAKAAVHAATVARDQAKAQQEVLVKNAYAALLNSTPQAYPEDAKDADQPAPQISGSYRLGKEGTIVVDMYRSASDTGYSFNLSGLVSGTGTASAVTPQPLGDSGLYILFPEQIHSEETWLVTLPNTKAADYVTNYNAYRSARQAQTQAVATADAAVTEAESKLAVVAATARPEDVASAKAQIESARGALQIAQAAYDARRIIAPGDGTVTAVHISEGQAATANAPAIEMSGASFAKEAAVTVPNEAVASRDGASYVRVKTADGIIERKVVAGVHDSRLTEIVSGIAAGDEVVI